MKCSPGSPVLCFLLCFFLLLLGVSYSRAAGFEELVLYIPEFLREVDVVSVRILKSCDLLPEGIDLCAAVLLYLRDVRRAVDALAVTEYGNKELTEGVILAYLALPRLCGIEDFKRLRLVYHLVVHADKICGCLSVLLVVDAVDLFEVRVGYLLRVFGNLYLRDYLAFLFLCDKLINSAENRVRFRGDKPLADAEGVYFRALKNYIADYIFVERI